MEPSQQKTYTDLEIAMLQKNSYLDGKAVGRREVNKELMALSFWQHLRFAFTKLWVS